MLGQKTHNKHSQLDSKKALLIFLILLFAADDARRRLLPIGK